MLYQSFNASTRAFEGRDAAGALREVLHHQHPFRSQGATTARALAEEYLRSGASGFAVDATELRTLAQKAAGTLTRDGVEYRLDEEKTAHSLTTVGYVQTVRGLPVWQRGVAVQVGLEPLRVISARFTGEVVEGLHAASAAKVERLRRIQGKELAEILPLAELDKRAKQSRLQVPTVNLTRAWVYRYDASARVDAHPSEGAQTHKGEAAGFPHEHPTLPLPPVPEAIRDGGWYVVVEVLFTLTVTGRGSLNWRALIEPDSGAVLHLRALVDGVDALVFPTDPVSLSGAAANSPSATATTLNPLRQSVTLQGLNAPVGGVQSLAGQYVTLSDFYTPSIAAPTEATGTDFDYDARSNNFGAVNAYHHCDAAFRLVASMGFSMATYFDGTTFPVPVDHRGSRDFDGIFGGSTDNNGNQVNAQSLGNASGNGQGGLNFFLADTTDTTHPLGIATDARVVLHEFGHTILWDHVNSPNFGFAHSAGDALAAILSDPDSQAPDRFETFPFTFQSFPASSRRRHDRTPAAGWGWAGSIALNPFGGSDGGGYSNEQILSTTLFRFYLSIGGDSPDVGRRRFAARMTAYLIFSAVGSLTPFTNASTALAFANALITADAGAWTSEGLAGGAYHKVIRWAFERQGLYQPAGAATPNNNEGAPPDVDVYIDDGRGGQYPFLPNHWSTTDIWNRTSVGDGGGAHQHPIVGQTNFAYVRIKNRGTQTATGIVVKGFHCNPGIGLVYPTDWAAMTTSQLPAANLASGGDAVIGPFEWTPSQLNHECMFFSVSATGDASNIDGSITGSIPEWRLVPNDNNIAQRNVSPVPGAGGAALAQFFRGLEFSVRNTLGRRATVRLLPTLPPLLAKRGWTLDFVNAGGAEFTLDAGERVQVAITLRPGAAFTAEELAGQAARTIEVTGVADGIVLGGMRYEVDPSLDHVVRSVKELPTTGRPGHREPCRDLGDKLLGCLDLEAGKVRRVRVRRVTVDIDFDDCE